MATERLASFVGGAYIFIGVVGFVCNTATVLMIATNRVYRLSAYTMMANVALADAIMMLIAGVMCGSLIVWPSTQTIPRSAKGGPSSGVTALFGSVSSEVIRDSEAKPSVSKTEFSYLLERRPLVTTESNSGVALYGLGASSTLSYSDDYAQRGAVMIALSLFEIAAWTAGVVSYAFLGLNRCVAICFYGTKAKNLNRVSVALFASVVTWVIGIITGDAFFPVSAFI
ncbi:putative G-protein coupled receptor K01A12.3 [Toxocara canis]|uniref:Putative G-protein coupled receptor K01A12.3 n=1 Tax=Toxocara canis TaxID=6265 RepID=A0A0B2VZ57_TOXCA|nr:putative G-protein coupled receptor K01A12.3 [Toxocara canis]